jgi:hypothetical protein
VKRPRTLIFSRKLLKQIGAGTSEWEASVPEEVARIIKARHFFGWPKKQ